MRAAVVSARFRRGSGSGFASLSSGVGFGQEKLKTDPGPSLNSLRVPWNLCVSAVVLAVGGHETIQDKMNWKEIVDVSTFVEKAMRGNPILAKSTGADFTGA